MAERYKIIVLGSNCFTGAHFIREGLQDGAEIIGMNRSPEPNTVLLPHRNMPKKQHGNYRFFKLDINNDMNEIMKITHKFQPDYVVNFAAQGMVGQSWGNPVQWFQTNTLAQVELHEHLRKLPYVKKYVQLSTPEVYGICEGLVSEHTHYQPSTPYGVSKAATDMSLMSYLRAYDFPVVFTRAANVYGPCQQLYRIIPRTILYILMGKRLQLHGGGVSVRSFIHIQDVVRATLQIMKESKPGSIYHLSTDELVSIRHLVETITNIMDVRFEDHVDVIEEDRLGKDPEYSLDCSKAHQELQWKPNYNLQSGLEETIKWVTDNFEILKTLEMEYIYKP
jgi:dTDP-glucose 4,6-dehydratase